MTVAMTAAAVATKGRADAAFVPAMESSRYVCCGILPDLEESQSVVYRRFLPLLTLSPHPRTSPNDHRIRSSIEGLLPRGCARSSSALAANHGSSSSSSCSSNSAAGTYDQEDQRAAGTTTTTTRIRRPPQPHSSGWPFPCPSALGRLAALAGTALSGLLLGPMGPPSFPSTWAPATAIASTTTTTTTTRAAVTLDTLSSSGSNGGASGGGIDYGCLLGRCGKELGQALLDPRGMHELACLVTCGPSDLACQVRDWGG